MQQNALTRRSFVKAGAAIAATTAASGLWPASARASAAREFTLRAAPSKSQLLPAQYPATPVWSYNGSIPGQEIRVRQGERLRVTFENALAEDTTVHWHGIRLPHAMDGVPYLTQPPVRPGGKFVYEFDAVDAGTFWYHPHQKSYEQVDSGLAGALIIEEKKPPRADRDITWVMDDWRLQRDGTMRADFGHMGDVSHGGRIGNFITVNGADMARLKARSNERIRLRLVNAANARIFALEFAGLEPMVIAIDGQPVTPHRPDDGRIVIAPSMRVDLMLDMTGKPGSRTVVTDKFYRRGQQRIAEIDYAPKPLRGSRPDWPMNLPPNPIPEPDMKLAERHRIDFHGGMMAGMAVQRLGLEMPAAMNSRQGMMRMMQSGKIWLVNGKAADGYTPEPFLKLAHNRSHIIEMVNATAWHHPIHLHGHSFRVISRNGKPTRHREWQDSVLMNPLEKVEIAFVADNPGKWMFHCHILEHQAGGMMGVVEVA